MGLPHIRYTNTTRRNKEEREGGTRRNKKEELLFTSFFFFASFSFLFFFLSFPSFVPHPRTVDTMNTNTVMILFTLDVFPLGYSLTQGPSIPPTLQAIPTQ